MIESLKTLKHQLKTLDARMMDATKLRIQLYKAIQAKCLHKNWTWKTTRYGLYQDESKRICEDWENYCGLRRLM